METQAVSMPKKTLAVFTHDMAELETKAFVLKETIATLKSKTETLIHEKRRAAQNEKEKIDYDYQVSERKVKECIDLIRELNQYIANSERSLREPVKRKTEGKTIALGVLAVILTVFFWPLAIPCWISVSRREKDRTEEYKKAQRLFQYEKQEYQKALNRLNEQNKKLKQEKVLFDMYEEQKNQAYNRVKNIDKEIAQSKEFICLKEQINIASVALNQLELQMGKLYAYSPIPPDYKTLDSMVMFDQIFRNDLADTMREAVMIYEERVFRGDVIKGMDKIYSMLGNLTAAMMYMAPVIEKISDRVEELCQNTYEVSQKMTALHAQNEELIATNTYIVDEYHRAADMYQDTQAKLLEETRLNRYAAEALKESNEKLAWYEEQRRLGFL